MSALIAQFWPYILAGAIALGAIAKSYLSGRTSGVNSEKAKQNDALQKHYDDIAAASRARAGVSPGVPDKGKYRRD